MKILKRIINILTPPRLIFFIFGIILILGGTMILYHPISTLPLSGEWLKAINNMESTPILGIITYWCYNSPIPFWCAGIILIILCIFFSDTITGEPK
jgi:hypothetical protein